MMKIILASQSPRRKQLLTEAGYHFTVIPPDDDAEDVRRPNEPPQELVQRLAVQKARNVAAKVESGLIIACDTVAVCDQEILGKPLDRNDARRMLTMLSGQKHYVFSGLCVLPVENPTAEKAAFDETELWMQPLTEDELEHYLDSNTWRGKAGAFGYQDGIDWIHITRGSESNVVGLPMELLNHFFSTR